MAIEMPGAFPDSGPRPAGIVGEEDPLSSVRYLKLLGWRLRPLQGRDDRVNGIRRLVVMVAQDQHLAAHQSREDRANPVAVVEAHREIPDVKNRVIGTDYRIPRDAAAHRQTIAYEALEPRRNFDDQEWRPLEAHTFRSLDGPRVDESSRGRRHKERRHVRSIEAVNDQVTNGDDGIRQFGMDQSASMYGMGSSARSSS